MRKLESNANLRLTLESLQMPTVEYKEINMEDYSKCRGNMRFPCSPDAPTRVCVCVPALSLQILKPAAFTGASHYPLLLLVYVGTRDDARTPTCGGARQPAFNCTFVQRRHPRRSGGDGAVSHGLGHGAGEQLRRRGGALRRAGQRLSGHQPAASHPEEAGRV